MGTYAAMPLQSGGSQSRGVFVRQSTPPCPGGPNALHNGGGGHTAHPYFTASNNYGQCQHPQPQPPTSSSQPPPNANQFQSEVTNVRAGTYQHSPIPLGNPTPPLTPASNMPMYAIGSSQTASDMKMAIGGDLKPNAMSPVSSYAAASNQQLMIDTKPNIVDTKPLLCNPSEWSQLLSSSRILSISTYLNLQKPNTMHRATIKSPTPIGVCYTFF